MWICRRVRRQANWGQIIWGEPRKKDNKKWTPKRSVGTHQVYQHSHNGLNLLTSFHNFPLSSFLHLIKGQYSSQWQLGPSPWLHVPKVTLGYCILFRSSKNIYQQQFLARWTLNSNTKNCTPLLSQDSLGLVSYQDRDRKLLQQQTNKEI